ncbi:transcription factor E2F3 isoform X1 [Oryzias latipes]
MKARLELDVVFSLDTEGDGGFLQPEAPHRSRCDTSLGLLTQKFADMLRHSPDGVLDLNVVCQKLGAPKRRVYDITNVLEGIKLIRKKSKSHIQWLGGHVNLLVNGKVKALEQEEKNLDRLIQNCAYQIRELRGNQQMHRYAYLTYKDIREIPSLKEETVILIKAPPETTLQVPHPEESLQVYLHSVFGPIDALLCSDELVPVESVGAGRCSSLAAGREGSSHTPPFSQVSSGSLLQVSPETTENRVCRVPHHSDLQPKLTQQFLPPSTPLPGSAQPPRTDGPKPTPTVAINVGGEQYLLSLTEDGGIGDLFSAHLDQSPSDVQLL